MRIRLDHGEREIASLFAFPCDWRLRTREGPHLRTPEKWQLLMWCVLLVGTPLLGRFGWWKACDGLAPHRWSELRRFRGVLESGTIGPSEIAGETGLDREDGPQVPLGAAAGDASSPVAERAVAGEGDRRVRTVGRLGAAGGNPDEGRGHPRAAGGGVRVHRRFPARRTLCSGSPPEGP